MCINVNICYKMGMRVYSASNLFFPITYTAVFFFSTLTFNQSICFLSCQQNWLLSMYIYLPAFWCARVCLPMLISMAVDVCMYVHIDLYMLILIYMCAQTHTNTTEQTETCSQSHLQILHEKIRHFYLHVHISEIVCWSHPSFLTYY